MLANIKGAFTEIEIGEIAEQLLQQTKLLHAQDIHLYLLTPQTILIKDGFKRKTPIKLSISHIGAMLVS